VSILSQLWWSGVDAVGGKNAVVSAITDSEALAATEVIAVGKAAASMCDGALALLPERTPALVVTKEGHLGDLRQRHPQVEGIEAGHPIPDSQSLLAGQRLQERMRNFAPDTHLLLLISGGASALAERLPSGESLAGWQQKTAQLVASGADIATINEERSKLSLIKRGRLLKAFPGQFVTVLAISDVRGDDIAVIGSGLGDPRHVLCESSVRIVASNATARSAVAGAAESQGVAVCQNSELLYDDVFCLAAKLAEALHSGPKGLYIWGGEPTIELPAQPGLGGRNQSLSLALARELSKTGDPELQVEVLVAGTDGTDGPTAAAGGWIRDAAHKDPAELDASLATADAGTWLAEHDELFVTGPTNTNVMDLVLCLKR